MTMMFAMIQQQHQEYINQMKESNKQALEMAQQSTKKMAEQMTVMYNKLYATEKENYNPNKEKGQFHQRKKIQCTKEVQKANASKSTPFRKYCFERKENEKHWLPNWKTRAE